MRTGMKIAGIACAAALAAALGAPMAFAAGRLGACVDANSDGICDISGVQIGANTGSAVKTLLARCGGAGFVDADGDGVCDNYGTGLGGGNGYGNGYCNGNGAGFVDADGDGVCDNYGTGNGCGNGYGNGAGNGNGCGNGNGACRGRN